MKKLKKFEIIESGRFNGLAEAEMDRIQGGKEYCESNYQHCVSSYTSCTVGIVYKSCEVTPSLTGFESSGSDVFCDSGYTYTQCTSGLPKETCSTDGVYSTYP